MSCQDIYTSYNGVLDDIKSLQQKLNLFINGSDTDVVPVNNGTIKTLSGIQKQLLTFQFVQKIIDLSTYQVALNGAPNFDEGMLIRIFNDPNTNLNGIYQVQGGGLLKISYASFYDLAKDAIGIAPFNFLNTKYTYSDITSGKNIIITKTISSSSASPYFESIKGQLIFTSKEPTKRGILSFDWKADIFMGSDIELFKNITTYNSSYVNGDILFNTTFTPTITCEFENVSVGVNKYTLKISTVDNITSNCEIETRIYRSKVNE